MALTQAQINEARWAQQNAPQLLGNYRYDTGSLQNAAQQLQSNPVTIPQSVSQPVSSGSSYQDQWSALGRSGTPPVGWHGESAPSTPSINFDELYSPVFQAIDQSKQGASSIYNSQLGNITQQATNAKSNVDTSLAQLETQFQTGKSQLDSQQQGAYNQLLQQYNNTRSGYLAQYGGGNSASQALVGLLDNAYLTSKGNVGQNYTTSLGNLIAEQQRGYTWASQQKANIDSDVQNMQQQAYEQYMSSLQSLNNLSANAYAQKAAQNAQAQQTLQAQLQQINLYSQQKQIDLGVWFQQYNAQLEAGKSSLAQQYTTYLSQNPFANSNSSLNDAGSYTSTGYNYDTGAYNTIALGKKYDIFGNVIG